MNIIRQTKNTWSMKKHYLMSETAKATHSSSRARMISGSLHQMRSSDDRDTSGTINIILKKKREKKTTRLRAHILQRSSHNVAKYARHANILEVIWLWHQNKTKHVWRKRTEAWSISGVRSRHHHLQRQIDANMIKSNDRIHASYEPP